MRCKECDRLYLSFTGIDKYCSAICLLKHSRKVIEAARQRAREKNINKPKIGICSECSKKIDINKEHIC